MSNSQKQWGAIIVMIALFAMIAFVTNLCTPMATIIKNQGEISNVLAQIGNYGNFIAYLVMGIPAGILIAKYGYKKTAMIGLVVGIVGILIQWFSGQLNAQENIGLVFGVYLIGAFVAGLCMCILNCVVNPMLNLLGGGGNKGNQLIQIGGVFNSSAAVACYILMGALIADATKAKIADATPALMIALAVFVIALVVIAFTKIEEPKQAPVQTELISGALKHRHFTLGALAIFVYLGIEVGVPNFVNLYLSSDTEETKNKKTLIMSDYEANKITAEQAAISMYSTKINYDSIMVCKDAEKIEEAKKEVNEISQKIKDGNITVNSISKTSTGVGIDSGIAGLVVAVYWFMMLIGRFIGASIGNKVSSRTMVTVVSTATIILVLIGMYLPKDILFSFPGVDWGKFEFVWQEIPVAIGALLFVGLCTSVMWGAIFNMAVEKLGKYTAIASGIFMTMVCGCAVMMFIQATVADMTDYITSFWVVLFCAAYILFYALIGSRVSKSEEE